ncbi:MAG TPA: hypothetical protein VFC15_19775, partial [Candidatus Limnocylindrales bacterium]|nr:hypothetical protein [Candidatus Limnocylindrales bacterium]
MAQKTAFAVFSQKPTLESSAFAAAGRAFQDESGECRASRRSSDAKHASLRDRPSKGDNEFRDFGGKLVRPYYVPIVDRLLLVSFLDHHHMFSACHRQPGNEGTPRIVNHCFG